MGALCYFEEFTRKKFVNEVEGQLENLERAISFCCSVSEKGWERFNKILAVAEKKPGFWDEVETQKDLQSLCDLIDVRDLATQDDAVTTLSLGSLKEFLRGIDQDYLKVSWDFLHSIDGSFLDLPLKKIDPLFPEDVLGLFVVLDRMILFLREEQRCIRYNFTSKRIHTFNEHDFSLVNENSQRATL